MVLMGLVLVGCGDVNTKDPLGTSADAPGPGASQEEVLLYEIALATDFFQWYQCREKYREIGEKNNDLETALKLKEQKLRKKRTLENFDQETDDATVSDALELVAFDWKMKDEDPGEGQEATFIISWLFYKKGPISQDGQRLELVLRAFVDPAHKKFLKNPAYDRPMLEMYWNLALLPEAWPANDYQLLSYEKKVPSLPYSMNTWLVWDSRTGTQRGNVIERLNLGWYVDLGR
jgi:hypothetical protein